MQWPSFTASPRPLYLPNLKQTLHSVFCLFTLGPLTQDHSSLTFHMNVFSLRLWFSCVAEVSYMFKRSLFFNCVTLLCAFEKVKMIPFQCRGEKKKRTVWKYLLVFNRLRDFRWQDFCQNKRQTVHVFFKTNKKIYQLLKWLNKTESCCSRWAGPVVLLLSLCL